VHGDRGWPGRWPHLFATVAIIFVTVAIIGLHPTSSLPPGLALHLLVLGPAINAVAFWTHHFAQSLQQARQIRTAGAAGLSTQRREHRPALSWPLPCGPSPPDFRAGQPDRLTLPVGFY